MTDLKLSNTLDDSDLEAINRWQADRALRRRVPLRESIRGCIGLAMLYEQPERAINHGDRCLFHNDRVRWLALHDIPANRFQQNGRESSRNVAYASQTTAVLRRGMPAIDFKRTARDSWTFSLQPFAQAKINWRREPWQQITIEADGDVLHTIRDRREFLSLNKLSAAMSNFAFGALSSTGEPLRRPWHAVRPAWIKSFRPVPPTTWFPQAFVAFERKAVAELMRLMQAPAPPFTISIGYKRDCTDVLAEGLPLRTTHRCTYRGCRPWGIDVLQHEFAPSHSVDSVTVCLPRTAPVHIIPGQQLEAGELWAHGLPGLPETRWLSGDCQWRWTHLEMACGSADAGRLLQSAWLWHQLIFPEAAPELALIPSHLVACIALKLAPIGLYWEVSRSMAYDDWELEALIFPPLRLQRWYRSRFCLPGEVDFDATIVDPRLHIPDRIVPIQARVRPHAHRQRIAG